MSMEKKLGDVADDGGSSNDNSNGSDPDVRGVDQFCRRCIVTYNVVVSVLVRILLFIHATLVVWLMVSLTGQTVLWSLLSILALLVIEAIFTVVKKKGRESKWICTCFVAYLCAVLPPIWMIELHRLEKFNDALDENSTLIELASVNGLTVPFKLESNLLVSAVEQALLFLLVLCRWLLPRGDISRNDLSQLLFVFMGIASDNMELFELFDETEVRKDKMLTLVVLGVWSLSLTQFVFVLTATRNLQKGQVIHVASGETEAERRRKKRKKKTLCELAFATEIWSLMFSMLVQDGPYAGVRIYTLVTYDLLTYSIIFFICKNLLVICLVMYRLAIICVTKCMDDDEDEAVPIDAYDNNSLGRTSNGRRRLLSHGAPHGSKVTPNNSDTALTTTGNYGTRFGDTNC